MSGRGGGGGNIKSGINKTGKIRVSNLYETQNNHQYFDTKIPCIHHTACCRSLLVVLFCCGAACFRSFSTVANMAAVFAQRYYCRTFMLSVPGKTDEGQVKKRLRHDMAKNRHFRYHSVESFDAISTTKCRLHLLRETVSCVGVGSGVRESLLLPTTEMDPHRQEPVV